MLKPLERWRYHVVSNKLYPQHPYHFMWCKDDASLKKRQQILDWLNEQQPEFEHKYRSVHRGYCEVEISGPHMAVVFKLRWYRE